MSTNYLELAKQALDNAMILDQHRPSDPGLEEVWARHFINLSIAHSLDRIADALEAKNGIDDQYLNIEPRRNGGTK